jgi:hypothetical protein
MKPGAVRAFVWVGTALALAGWACESARNPGGFIRDLVPPQLVLSTTQDTQAIANGMSFTASATDNLALNDIRLIYSGGLIDTTDTIFYNQTLKQVNLAVHLTFPITSGAGGFITIVGRATDGAGNFGEDTLLIFLSNVQALTVQLLSPANGAVASTGKSLLVDVVAKQLSGIRKVGFIVAPPAAVTNPTLPPDDSILYTVPFQDSVEYVDTLTVVQATGTFTITGFAEDSAGRRATTNVVTVTVLSAANDNTPPQVSESLLARIEVNDSVIVHATDPSGISEIGFRVRLASDTTIVLSFVSIPQSGAFTDVVMPFSLQLASIITSFPTNIVVDGYACDAAVAHNCAFSNQSNFVFPPPKSDSAQVVAGVTIGFPRPGTHIADAIFNKNAGGGTGELYLTNNPMSRVEVFQVANTSFVQSGILTAGPQPWGIALWPRDTLGGYGDSIVVADAGGTEFSIIDVVQRRLKWRQDLPNYLVELYKVIQIAAGVYTDRITVHDLSDRPQYVATVCRVGAAPPNCDADSIFALYSTTPTISSSSPFNGKGTLRMEKLINSVNPAQLFGHFFWEIGRRGPSNFTDTLRIEMRRGRPYNDTQTILSACAGVTINFAEFGLGDTSYARNSGDFTHSFFGEGGNAASDVRRVMSYTTKAALNHGAPTFLGPCNTSPDTLTGPQDFGFNDEDRGMSDAVDVNDFISNTGVKIASIATNFNGGTNLVRADSIYYLDEGLRLKGLSDAPMGAFGMDMNYDHRFAAGQGGTPAFGGTLDSTNRVAFAADPSGNILVFDTFFYGLITSIPVRDPIVGPLRVAKDAGGNQLLFGVTSRGLVMVRIPAIPNPNPAPPRLRANNVRRP